MSTAGEPIETLLDGTFEGERTAISHLLGDTLGLNTLPTNREKNSSKSTYSSSMSYDEQMQKLNMDSTAPKVENCVNTRNNKVVVLTSMEIFLWGELRGSQKT